ncbi:MAG: M20/M25/M40 family metallo-hydrolase [Enterocloster clostridioformis]
MEEYETSHQIAEKLPAVTWKGWRVITGAAGGARGRRQPDGSTRALRHSSSACRYPDAPLHHQEEKPDFPFSSETPGIVHACWARRDYAAWHPRQRCNDSWSKAFAQWPVFPVTWEFVFQPGEENGIGGRKMVEEDRILENPAVDAVFAAHAWPEAAAGEMCVAERMCLWISWRRF